MASSTLLTVENDNNTAILLRIFSHCDLKTLLHLRLVSRHLNTIITHYESTPDLLHTIAENTFPPSTDISKIPLEHSAVPNPSLKWLLQLPRGYIVQATTTKAVASAGSWLGFHVPATDTFGDKLRARIERGLFILWHLSDIARHITTLSLSSARKITKKDLEQTILQARLHYVFKHLTAEDMFDFELMYDYVPSYFYNKSVCDLDSTRRRWIGRKDSWVNWLVLREGPTLLYGLWMGQKEAMEKVEEEWWVRGGVVREVERKMAAEFHKELKTRWPKTTGDCVRWIAELQEEYLMVRRGR